MRPILVKQVAGSSAKAASLRGVGLLVLLLSVPAILIILGARKRLRQSPGDKRAVTRPARMAPGAVIRARALETVGGGNVPVPDPGNIVHLQFRRFAGCPVCHLHLRSFVRRHEDLRAAGVREVVVFHSSTEELREHVTDLPFEVVADPEKLLYREFGIASAPRALLDPRAWGAVVVGILRTTVAVLRGRERLPPARPNGGSLGLPGDFLVDPVGRVLAAKYGEHADDHFSTDEVLGLAARARHAR